MRLPVKDKSNATDVDMEQVKQMVDIFMERGFTYFDTAWMYNAFASESAAKEALVDRYPRESFTLATKLHAGFINSLEDRDKIFNAQLEKTGAGYFDYYLLHGIETNPCRVGQSVLLRAPKCDACSVRHEQRFPNAG